MNEKPIATGTLKSCVPIIPAPVAFAPEVNRYWSLGEVLGSYGFTTRKT